MNILSGLLDTLYPRFCRLCGGELDGIAGRGSIKVSGAKTTENHSENTGRKYFCLNCLGKLRTVPDDGCPVCGRPYADVTEIESHPCRRCVQTGHTGLTARAPVAFEGVIREAIHLFKYDRYRAMSGYLGGFISDGAVRWFGGCTICAPVPLHKKRLRHRGFNQAIMLAQAASNALNIPISDAGLIRSIHTRPQVELGPGEREHNVKGAFAVTDPAVFLGQRVLLIDDVYTTGATVRECARVLRTAGAVSVSVLTVARVI